jgi:transcriptional regulator with XRE-family HTH domain
VKAKSIAREEYKSLIKALVKSRKAANISQHDLAKKLGWSQPEISKYEHFVRRIDVVEFVDICEALGIDYKQLISRTRK